MGARKAWQTIKEGEDLQWQFHFKADLEPGFMNVRLQIDLQTEIDDCCVLNDWVEVWELGRDLGATARRSSNQSYLGWKWGRRGRAS